MCKATDYYKKAISDAETAKDVLMRMKDNSEISLPKAVPNVFTKIPKDALAEGEMEWMELYGKENIKLVFMDKGSVSKPHAHERVEWFVGVAGETTYVIMDEENKVVDSGILKIGDKVKIEKGTFHVILSAIGPSYAALKMED